LTTDTTYAFKVSTLNAIGPSRNGVLSPATPTVVARAGASASHTSLAGSSLTQGVAGVVYEEQIITASCASYDTATGYFRLRLGTEGTWSGSIAPHANATDVRNALEGLTYNTNLNLVKSVHVTRKK